MKTILSGLLVVLILCVHSSTANGQQTSDAGYLFKMWLFMERSNVGSSDAVKMPVKDSSYLSFFTSHIFLDMDTLKAKGFPADFLFVALRPAKDRMPGGKKAIEYAKNNKVIFLDIPLDNCGGYVLGVNQRTGRSYRLGGFRDNDFVQMLRDLKNEYQKTRREELTDKVFFKTHSVQELDLSCLYKGLQAGGTDTNKYPCLRSCDYTTVTIH